MGLELIVKTYLPDFRGCCFRKMRPLKLTFTTNLPVKGRIHYCENYESRSGLHWDYCLDREFNKIYGPVRLLRRLVRYQPSEILRSGKESKNLVGLDFMKKEALEMLAELYMLGNTRDYLLISNSDYVEIWEYKAYDKRLMAKPEPVFARDNLKIFSIPEMPRWIEGLFWTVDRAASLGDYVFIANDNFMFTRSERRIGKKKLETLLIYIPEDTVLKMIDRDYRILDLNLEPGLYLVTLLLEP